MVLFKVIFMELKESDAERTENKKEVKDSGKKSKWNHHHHQQQQQNNVYLHTHTHIQFSLEPHRLLFEQTKFE